MCEYIQTGIHIWKLTAAPDIKCFWTNLVIFSHQRDTENGFLYLNLHIYLILKINYAFTSAVFTFGGKEKKKKAAYIISKITRWAKNWQVRQKRRVESELETKKANDKHDEIKKFFWNNAAWEEIWSDLIKMLESWEE